MATPAHLTIEARPVNRTAFPVPALLAVVLVVAACAQPAGRTSSGTRPDCSANRAYRDYIDEVARQVAEAAPSLRVLPRREAATLRVLLSTRGAVLASEVVKATSPEAADLANESLHAGAPYPVPLPGVRHCIVDQPFTVLLVSLRADPGCDEAAVGRYYDGVAARVAAALDDRPYRDAPGAGRVDLRIEVDEAGVVRSVAVRGSAPPAASRKALAVLEEVAPFPPPSPEVAACVSLGPFLIRVQVPGSEGGRP